jgi:uncharacterized protein
MPELFRISTDRVTLQWSVADDHAEREAQGIEPAVGYFEVKPCRRDAEPIAEREGFAPSRLHEETRYTVFLWSDVGRVQLLHEDPALVGELVQASRGRGLAGTINFRSHVGRSRFRVVADGEAEFEFEVEVFPSKIDYADDFADLVSDTQDFLSGLALQYLAATRNFGIAKRPPGRTTYLEWLSLLRNVFDDLEKGVRQIARRPRRALHREVRRSRLERVRRVDSAVRNALRRTAELRSVRHYQAELSLDTPEHRWLADQLAGIRRHLQALLKIETTRAMTRRQIAIIEELRSMDERVAALQRLEPIRSATAPAPAGFASLQLIKAPGYRDAYVAATLLSLAVHIHADALSVSLKDIATLYEYWCFFTVVRAISEATHSVEPLFRMIRTSEEGLKVTLRRGETQTIRFRVSEQRTVSVTYNPRYRTSLIAQAPDIVVTIDDDEWPTATMVLDAKYRLDTTPEYVSAYGAPGPPAEALNVLHRYRDAILESAGTDKNPSFKRSVIQAAALYPYRERSEGDFAQSHLWKALQRIGVGAVPLLPRGQRYLDLWLDSVLSSGGWALSDRAIPHRSHDASWEWRRAANEPVLIAPLRRDQEAEHLAWIERTRLFYTPETKQPRLFATKWVAFYRHGSARKRGTIESWAEVESIEVRRRSEIETPWPARRDPDERQVVFHLRDIRAGLSIVNTRGERVSTNRWSTRLALMRAKRLEELLLETEPEWRLYEHLLTTRQDVKIGSGRVRSSATEPQGRAVFRVRDDEVRHEHGSRFAIVTGSMPSREITLDELLLRYSLQS